MPDRLEERTEIIRILKSGKSIQMLAPRRVGKTWLMHKVAEDLGKQGWLTPFIDLEGMRSENEFLRDLCTKLQAIQPLKSSFLGHLGHRLKELSVSGWEGNPLNAIGKVDPKIFCGEIIAALDEQKHDTVIMLDEIALFVMKQVEQNKSATHDFLYHLRKLRQMHRRIRWFMTGSIGLDIVARRSGLAGSLVDLAIVPLEPFTDSAAKEYLDRKCRAGEFRRPFRFEAAAFDRFARGLGWLAPYYLDLVGDQVDPKGPAGNDGRPEATPEDVERALDQLVKPPYRPYFATWEEHIDKNFAEPDRGSLSAILDGCCEQPDGETFATLQARLAKTRTPTERELNDLLTILVNDGYLEEADGRWRFRSGLLRRYWHRYRSA